MFLTININYSIHAQELDTIDCLSSQFLPIPSSGTTVKPSFSCSLLDLTKGETDSLPIVRVRVNVHIVNNQPTYPNFYWGPATDWNELNANKFGPLVVQEMNDIMQTLDDNPIQSSDFIGDSRIRFELYTDSTNTNDLHNGVWIHSNNPLPNTFEYGDYVLNIIIQSQSSGKCQNGFSPGVLTQNYINVYGDPNCILSDSTIGWWSIGRVAIHEFLHSASLCHSFYGGQNCAGIDLDAIAECNNGGGTGNCGTIGSCDNWNSGSNNIMGYNVGAQSLTPCQWAQAYETLHMVQPNYITICDFNPNDIVINNGENIIWDHLKLLNQNVTIKSGGQLTSTCEVRMAPNNFFYVERSGRLIIDGGYITNMCKNMKWEGIMVEGNNSLAQPSPLGILTPNKAGVVYTKNNALIEMANNAISTNPLRQPWPQWNDYTGGLVVCENTDFKNNERAIEFMKYDNTETSKIFNCDFFESDSKCSNSRGITIWKTNGLEIDNSRFFNLDKFGIYGIDYGAKVINGCSFNNIYDKGIESYETAPYSSNLEVGSSSSIPNYFTDIPIMIYSSSSAFGDGLQIINNNFYNGGYGIAVSGQSNYLIRENSFDKFRIGVQTENTANYNNYVSCNSFYNEFDSGILFAGNNGAPYVGCQFLQNLFQDNPVDIRLVRAVDNTIGSVRGYIGSSIIPAENCFTPNIINIVAPISNTTTFNYYLNNNISCHDPNGSLTDGGTNNYYENYSSVGIAECIKITEGNSNYNEVLNYFNNGGANDDENSELIYNSLKKLTHELYGQNKLNELKILLEAEGSVQSKRTLYGIYLKKGLVNKAEEYLNSLPIDNDDDQDFLEIQEINIKFHRLGIESITPDDSLKLELKNIISNPSSGYAKGLLALFYEKSFQPNDYSQIDQNIIIDPNSNNYNDVIYPNPVTNTLNLEFNSNSNGESVIEIIDLKGSKTVYNKNLQKGMNKLTFDISEYNSGLYVLKFNSDNNIRVIKFIKL